MSGSDDEKPGDSGPKAAGPGEERPAASLAARRRRIEMMRERQELMALLDDFGDGDLELDLELMEDDEDDVGRWVAAEGADLGDDDDDSDVLEDDDDFYDEDDDFEDED